MVLAGAANAQLSNLTQAPVPLGGSDTRGLPNRAALPPMFGANLFRTGPLTSFGVMPGSATIATSGGRPEYCGTDRRIRRTGNYTGYGRQPGRYRCCR